jgi:hypothetical protein
MQVFAGHAKTTLLALMLKDNGPVSTTLDFIKSKNLIKEEKLSVTMTEIHVQVAEKATRDRKYVLVSKYRKIGTFKLQVKWKSPCRIARVESDYMFAIENLLTKNLKAAHTTSLRLYQDKKLNVTEELA